MKKYRMPKQDCPKCGYSMDGASNATGKGRPKPGDISICINCAQILKFGPKMELVVSDIPENLNPRNKRALAAAAFFIKNRGLIYSPILKSKWGKEG